ncbi:hypothetical protein PGT21_000380 [Puccinia graminis f. sp. tritici]|uniref:Uncharacterized protein n=1 Tax=Puccinia graminis f. sp. tritici TaxID=56615 RepID=A0A5B0N8M8_PUCGR|nr:hypothetical protein PGT21_000380 [Puccinia graminis f. sp. tritici]
MAERIRILEKPCCGSDLAQRPNAEGYDENDVNLVPALMTLTRGRTRQDGTNSGGGTVSIAERYRAMMDPFGALPRQHTDTHATPPQGNSGNHSPDEVLVDQGQGSSPGSSARAPRSLGGLCARMIKIWRWVLHKKDET